MTADSSQTHFLDLGRAGRVAFKITFRPDEIDGRAECPAQRLSRRDRRSLSRWLLSITKPLDSDPRPMRLVTTFAGRIVALGSEDGRGKVCTIHFP